MKETQLAQEKRWFVLGGILAALLLTLAVLAVRFWPVSAEAAGVTSGIEGQNTACESV